MRKLGIGLISLVMVLVLAACGSGDAGSANGKEGNKLETLQEQGSVKIGFANEKPYAYEEDGELKGAAVAIAQEVFANLGIEKVDGQLSEFGQLIPALGAGKFDVITAGMAITPDRCTNVAFGEPEINMEKG